MAQLWEALDAHGETMILVLDGLHRLRQLPWSRAGLLELETRLISRLVAMQQQMASWREQLLRDPLKVPEPPLPRWQAENLFDWLEDRPQPTLSVAEIDRLAQGLLLLNRLEVSLEECELAWHRAVTTAVTPGSLRP